MCLQRAILTHFEGSERGLRGSERGPGGVKIAKCSIFGARRVRGGHLRGSGGQNRLSGSHVGSQSGPVFEASNRRNRLYSLL